MEIISINEFSDKKQFLDFDCGEPALNTYLRKYATQNERTGYGRTFLALENGRLIGFYTLVVSSMQRDGLQTNLIKRLPKHPVPCILIARLAVNKSDQKRKVGKQMLFDALRKAVHIADYCGVAMVAVESKPGAVEFYKAAGFESITDNGLVFAIHINAIISALAGQK